VSALSEPSSTLLDSFNLLNRYLVVNMQLQTFLRPLLATLASCAALSRRADGDAFNLFAYGGSIGGLPIMYMNGGRLPKLPYG